MKNKIFLLIIVLITMTIIIPRDIKAETYEGKYSIEYLLRNYSAVTLGIKENNLEASDWSFSSPNYLQYFQNTKKGDFSNFKNVEGAVLINGDYTYSLSSPSTVNFGSQAGNIKSFIKGTKGSNVTTTSQLVADPNYIDFDKMYAQVMNESRMLADKTEHHLYGPDIEISSPGIYTINNAASFMNRNNVEVGYNQILIKNYDKNDYYIINMFDEYPIILPFLIMESGSSTAVPLETYIESGNYTGNIIYNFPNARYLHARSDYCQIGNQNQCYNESAFVNIIAPKADIVMFNFSYDEYYIFNGTIIANRIINYVNSSTAEGSVLKKSNYSVSKKILEEEGQQAISEPENYNDDKYYRDYSISDLLQNYNLVTLGKKSINSKSPLLQYGQMSPGSIKLFHITGQALIAGDLAGNVYPSERDSYFDDFQKFDRTVFDLESNEVTESYIKGNIFKNIQNIISGNNRSMSISVIQPWDNMTNDGIMYYEKKNNLFIDNNTNYDSGTSGIGNFSGIINNYLNFNRLYENITSEQKEIKEGKKVSVNDNKAKIKIGGQYVIDDINDINEIVFEDFEKNKDKLTIITIKNEGDINFPLISRDTGSYKGIVTNDYYGKEKATHFYEQNTFINEDEYHGNIIWNVPNATYIKLKENAPFAGHLIAPNADVESPELHFAGCFIVNSIYGEGNTEAHFYPITAYSTFETPDYSEYPESFVNKLNAKRLSNLLGGEGTQLRRTVLGDETQLREEEDLITDLLSKEKPPVDSSISETITQVLTNPATYRNIAIIILVISVTAIGIITARKKVKQ